jgi:peptidoglycan L-alanyl-D-glutamate endopeptidase CwlK
MPSRDINDLHPDIQVLCREFLARTHHEKINTFLTCTYRSPAEQDELYAQGRTKPGKKVTNARAGQSKHNFEIDGQPASKAFDFAVRNDDATLNWNSSSAPWERAGEIGMELGLNWGGSWKTFKDYPHFEID